MPPRIGNTLAYTRNYNKNHLIIDAEKKNKNIKIVIDIPIIHRKNN